MKKLIMMFLLMCGLLASCNVNTETKSEGRYGEYAKQAFLEKFSHMSERDALSREIDWYQEPQITEFSYIGEMSGKDIISISNDILAENKRKEEALSNHRVWVIYTYDVNDIKNHALDHPDEYVASKFHIAGTFTTFSKHEPYETKSCNAIVVRGVNEIILLSDSIRISDILSNPGSRHIVTLGISEFSPKWYERK